MVRHLAFFEALGSLEENGEAARRVTAGLVVLRLIDNLFLREESPRNVRGALRPVAEAVALLRDPDPAKRDLSAILEVMDNKSALAECLLAYGRTLDFEASWNLASDVFRTAAELAPESTPAIAADANTLLGAVARRAGDWDTSSEAYARAVQTAGAAGDLRRSLKAEVGLANNYFARGNLPAADEMLDGVLADSRAGGFDDVASMALHTRASVAHHRGQYADAVELAYNALSLSTDDSTRDVILTDIAAAFAELGMRDAARDAFLIASVISPSRVVRASTMLNLMDLASRDGMVQPFDAYCTELATLPLETRHRAYYLLFRGQGEQRLGRFDAAAGTLEQAKRFAQTNQMHQALFEAETAIAALTDAMAGRLIASAEPKLEISESARRIAGELTQMRELALAGSQMSTAG